MGVDGRQWAPMGVQWASMDAKWAYYVLYNFASVNIVPDCAFVLNIRDVQIKL